MSVEPVEISPVANLSQFFDTIFGTQTGYVYAPIKELTVTEGRKQPLFKRRFFQWPDQKEQLIKHVLTATGDHEVYYSPALWKHIPARDEEITPELFKGTYWVWADFDYGLPTKEQLGSLPDPTIRVQSSISSKEHWYWRLDFFNDNKEVLEMFTKRLTYALDSDPSGWDYVQVLRPPGTINHKRGNKKTRIVLKNSNVISIQALAALPEPPSDSGLISTDVDLTDIPSATHVIFKYKWDDDTADLFRKNLNQLNIKKGRDTPDRSGALMRLGYSCAEMGMSNPEIYSILTHADKRWQKFTNNIDPKKAYIKIINRARAKYPVSLEGEIEGDLPIYGFNSFLATTINIDWIIEGLLQMSGLLVLSSPPGVGKTQLSLWVAAHVAIGKEFNGWKVERPLRVMFFSMEMGHADLKYILEQMSDNFTDEEKELLEKNFLLVPMGYSLLLDRPANQTKLLGIINEFKPDGVMFDSLGVAIGDEISSDTVINNTFAFINKYIRDAHNCFVWFLHHNRKPQANNQKPKKLEDLYGSMYIGAQATTVIGLWPTSTGGIEVNCLKLRLGKHFDSFKLIRTQEPLGFKTSEESDPSSFITMMEGLTAGVGETNKQTGEGNTSTPDFGLE